MFDSTGPRELPGLTTRRRRPAALRLAPMSQRRARSGATRAGAARTRARRGARAAAARSCCSPARPASARRGFAEEVARRRPTSGSLRGAAGAAARSPYGPVVAALRGFLRAAPGRPRALRPAAAAPRAAAARAGRRRPRRATARRCSRRSAAACAAIAADGPAAMLLDDLQWSDEATLELLAALRRAAARAAAARRRRLPLRRAAALAPAAARCATTCAATALLDELTLEPLGAADTGALVEQVLGSAPSPRLAADAARPHRRRPVLRRGARRARCEAGGRLHAGPGRASSWRSTPTCRSRRRSATPCCVHAATLSDAARAAAEAAAVAGARFDLELVAALGGEDGLAELLATGLIVETEPRPRRVPPPARARGDLRRRPVAAPARAAPRASPRRSSARRRDPAEVATHWLAARDAPRALEALLDAIDGRAAVHAYRDAARLGRQALDLLARGRARRRSASPSLERYARPRRARGRARRGGARAARGRRRAPRGGRRPRARRRRAAHRRHLRAAGRPRARARRAARRRRGVRRQRPARRGRGRAAGRGGLPAVAPASTPRRSSCRAPPARRRCAPSAPTCAPGRWGSRASRGSRAARSTTGIETIRAGLSLALEHELTAGGGRGLPAARHRARDRRRLRRRARRARHGDRPVRGERRRRRSSRSA